jgi:hypothetical protein
MSKLTQEEGFLFKLENDEDFASSLTEKENGKMFYKLYKAIARTEIYKTVPLTWNDKIILCVIASYSTQKQHCYLSNAQFSYELAMGERTIAYSVKKLKELKLINVYRQYNNKTGAFTPIRRMSVNVNNIIESVNESNDHLIWKEV